MESLFKLTELEARVPLNMNVLVKGRLPQVLGLSEALREWLDHRREVLLRRSKHRLAEIEHRLEVLGGFLVAYLNLDKVIKIIRKEDEPKPVLMKTFKLTDVQADAILNMRLRNLRRLEEMQIRGEDKALREERTKLKSLIGSPQQQWKTIAGQIKETREAFGPKTALGKRRTTFGEAPQHDEAAIEEAMVVREPITVVVSDKGWIRALRGHVGDLKGVAFKTGDELKFAFPTETTAKILIFGSNGKFYTLEASKVPGGRGHGEPVRLYFDLEQDADVVAAMPYQGGRKFLVASRAGNGFVVKEDDVLGTTRKGKQVLNLKSPDRAVAIAPVEGDTVAAVGERRKMIIFGLDQVPEMARGRGVRLQRYNEKGLSDVTTFSAKEGLTWIDKAGRAFTTPLKELANWRGKRADAGRIAPDGFPRSNTFGRAASVAAAGKDNKSDED
jgi:topoisomerase-4 subunit A